MNAITMGLHGTSNALCNATGCWKCRQSETISFLIIVERERILLHIVARQCKANIRVTAQQMMFILSVHQLILASYAVICLLHFPCS